MGYEVSNVVKSFAERTLVNLEFIENQVNSGNKNLFEVTQLINSLLGLIVFPEQKFYQNLPTKKIEDISNLNWIRPLLLEYDKERIKDFRGLMKSLRNAISHCHIEFLTNEKNEIVNFKLWDQLNNSKPIHWETTLDITDLKEVIRGFIKIIRNDLRLTDAR